MGAACPARDRMDFPHAQALIATVVAHKGMLSGEVLSDGPVRVDSLEDTASD